MTDLYPLKAQYLEGEEVILRLELSDVPSSPCTINIYFLDELVLSRTFTPDGDVYDLCLGVFKGPFSGYGVEFLPGGGGTADVLETSFDVTDNPRRSLRYGFVSDFETGDLDNGAIEQLRKFHINMVQFYDWSYRHDQLISPREQYTDMMGKKIDLNTVKSKIRTASRFGMKTMAYGAVYAASEDFYETHRDWAFYTAADEVFRFIDVFYLMNPEHGSPWRSHLIDQYKAAVDKIGFSGIHMDTYGFPKTAFSHLGDKPSLVKLDQEFPGLIDETRNAMKAEGKDPYLVFNNVGNWPVSETARSTVDAVYIEVWPPYDRYFHIKQLITEAQTAASFQKPVILAAYLAPFRTEDTFAASCAAYILTASIVSNGAYHLLLGENQAVLTQGYYGDYSTMMPETAKKMRRYYDFMIRYLNLFYDVSLKDVSMTHIGWDNYEYQCGFDNWSVSGEAGKIWLTLRENDLCKCIYLVNLSGCSDDYWNKGKTLPVVQKSLTFLVQVDRQVSGVYTASPDSETERSIPLDFSYVENEKGRFVKFTLPELSIWAIVYIKLQETFCTDFL